MLSQASHPLLVLEVHQDMPWLLLQPSNVTEKTQRKNEIVWFLPRLNSLHRPSFLMGSDPLFPSRSLWLEHFFRLSFLGMLVTDSVNISSSNSVLISLFLKDIFVGFCCLGRHFFIFSTGKYCVLPSVRVPEEKPCALNCFPWQIRQSVSLAIFRSRSIHVCMWVLFIYVKCINKVHIHHFIMKVFREQLGAMCAHAPKIQ